MPHFWNVSRTLMRSGGRHALLIDGYGPFLLGCRIEPFARGLFAGRLGSLPAPILRCGIPANRSRCRRWRRYRSRLDGNCGRRRGVIAVAQSDIGQRTVPSAATAEQEAGENRRDHPSVHSNAFSKTHITLALRPSVGAPEHPNQERIFRTSTRCPAIAAAAAMAGDIRWVRPPRP